MLQTSKTDGHQTIAYVSNKKGMSGGTSMESARGVLERNEKQELFLVFPLFSNFLLTSDHLIVLPSTVVLPKQVCMSKSNDQKPKCASLDKI